MSHIHVIHENPEWLPPFAEAFRQRGLPWKEIRADELTLDLSAVPPAGVFYNRMSASAHTRGHETAPEVTRSLLAWLERHGRRVVNGLSAIDLEVSKARQYARLAAAGIRTPRTLVVGGAERLAAAARDHFGGGPFILKPNRGGKGLGVQLFRSVEGLEAALAAGATATPVDGVHLLQEYVEAPAPFITRAEFMGGRFLYAVRVDTSGGFELCPADACAVGDASCPVGVEARRPKFEIVEAIDPEQQRAYERFLHANGIEIAGIEFIVGHDGLPRTYDVNTNTNYNAEAEARAGVSAPRAMADFLGGLLAGELLRRAA